MTYSYDLNQRMHCKFEDVDSGRVLEVDVSLDEEKSESEATEGAKELQSLKVQ